MKRTRLDDNNALSSVVAAAAGVVAVVAADESEKKLTYSISRPYVHLLSDLPHCPFLSIQHLD